MCRLSPYEGIQRGPRIVYGDHVEDAVLPMLQEDDVARFDRRGDVCNSEIVAGLHVMDANGSSEHVGNRATAGRCSRRRCKWREAGSYGGPECMNAH